MTFSVFVLAASTAHNLFTTARDCTHWPYRNAWHQAGYTPFCMDYNFQKIIVNHHCKHRPIRMIQYSDIGRLLILYEKGGWYVDSDVEPTPLSRTLQSFTNTTFGLESNFGVNQAKAMGMLPKSIVLWTIFGIKGDQRLKNMACTLAHLSTEPQPKFENIRTYIHRTTGPTIQTRLWQGRKLPVNVFGCGQQHSNSPPCSASTCWGCHHFKNSWL